MDNIIINYIQQDLLNDQEEIELTKEDDLLGNGLIDSLGIMKLIQFIEKSYSIKIPAEDLTIEHFMTVEAIEDYLKQFKLSV